MLLSDDEGVCVAALVEATSGREGGSMVEKYKQQLLAIEQDLVRKIGGRVERARDASDDQPDPVDQGFVGELRDDYLALAQTDSEILEEVRAALGRIADGTFGRCIVDDEPIEESRLDAVPWTPRCLKHQQEVEEAAGVRTPRA